MNGEDEIRRQLLRGFESGVTHAEVQARERAWACVAELRDGARCVVCGMPAMRSEPTAVLEEPLVDVPGLGALCRRCHARRSERA